jgi:O-succinylbenzoate synthase
MAKSGLEMALLDASLREESCSLAHYLGATNLTIPAGASISYGTPEEVVAAAQLSVDAGYERVKCKIAPGFDVESVRALRESFPNLSIAVDANGSYDLGDSQHHKSLHALDDFGLTFIEQPLAPDELLDLATLATELETPVMLDESISSIGMLRLAISIRAGDGVCVKPARVGGVLAAKAMHDLCQGEDLHLSIGGMLETGIGRAAALAVGALPGFDLAGDLGGSERYFAPDLTVPHELQQGRLLVPQGPGLGIEPIESVIGSARVRSRVFQVS